VCTVLPKPLLVQSDLTGHYYIATRYTHKVAPNGTPHISCSLKYDATAEVQAYIDKETGALREERDALAARVAEYEAKAQALAALVDAVDVLIAYSGGVDGLHLNGEVAPWDDLTRGGKFEGWLGALDDARDLLLKKEANHG
jgi:hypothetical protein